MMWCDDSTAHHRRSLMPPPEFRVCSTDSCGVVVIFFSFNSFVSGWTFLLCKIDVSHCYTINYSRVLQLKLARLNGKKIWSPCRPATLCNNVQISRVVVIEFRRVRARISFIFSIVRTVGISPDAFVSTRAAPLPHNESSATSQDWIRCWI